MIKFGVNRGNPMAFYTNVTNIEISPENDIYFSFKMDNIPDTINIEYCDVTDIIDFFNSPEGGVIIQKIFSNEVKVNIYPADTTYITEEEVKYLIGHESLFKRHNVNFYQIWHHPDIQFKYHMGSTIHDAIVPFVKKYKNYSFDYEKKDKHFLTLNNYHTPDRESLLNIYKNLSEEDKQKFVCSFRFADIFLENEKTNFDEIFNDFNLVFGHNIFPYYDSCLIEIISESSHQAVTEKCFKPLLSGIPFIYWIYNSDFSESNHQVEIFKNIGIDTCYFGLDYTNKESIKEKIKELLSLSIDEIQVIYKEDFEKAKENKIKTFNWFETLTDNITK